MTLQVSLAAAAAYVLLGRLIVSSQARRRDLAFALLNLVAVYLFSFWGKGPGFELLFALMFFGYVAMVSLQYVVLRWYGKRSGWLPWLAFFSPIAMLVVIRYLPLQPFSTLLGARIHGVLQRHPEFTLASTFVGVSYLAFRTSHLVLEVRNGVVPLPGYSEYLGFAFFWPAFSVGPINTYSRHRQGFAPDAKLDLPLGRALLRVLVGAVKFKFLGPLLNQLTYSGLLLDGHPHHCIDLPIAAVAYYGYLYCNFSGFCDLAIGGAALLGISVPENFDNPFAARNVRAFWNRWHITLSEYMRDVVFSPLSKMLVRRAGPKNANHAIALTIVCVFLLVGIWHGAGWNYVAFGAVHALGVATNHYYTLGVKKRLGRAGFEAYNKSRLVEAAAVALTFSFVTASLFLFANDVQSMKTIWSMLGAT